jgi:hypothetical protein
MKTKEEIEQLANELIGTQFCGQINITDEVKEFYTNGYTQCQEDMTKEIDNLKSKLREFQLKEPKYAVEIEGGKVIRVYKSKV